MAAPERFAETSDSSCTAGAVHTWPITSLRCSATIRRLSGVERTQGGSDLPNQWCIQFVAALTHRRLHHAWRVARSNTPKSGSTDHGLDAINIMLEFAVPGLEPSPGVFGFLSAERTNCKIGLRRSTFQIGAENPRREKFSGFRAVRL
jgi:hypothetical protein